jgi:16S rRNA processing protein RimM
LRAALDEYDLLIGEVTSPQGLQGEMRVYPHTDYPDRFTTLKEIVLQQGQTKELKCVEHARNKQGVVILKLAGTETIGEAEKLRGARLYTTSSWLKPLGVDEYYHDQLIGLEVVTTEGESLGQIEKIWPTIANDVYETPLALIPAVKEYIIKVDLQGGRITVPARPGLKKSDPGT